MSADGTAFSSGQKGDPARFNKKSWFIGTGAQLAAYEASTDAQEGTHALCTSTGSGFTAGREYAMEPGSTSFSPYTNMAKLDNANTLAGTATSINLPVLTRENLRTILRINGNTSTMTLGMRFNADVGANYAYSISTNGGADSGASASSSIQMFPTVGATESLFYVFDVRNDTTKVKSVVGHGVLYGSTGTITSRHDFAGTWNNTSAEINAILVTRLTGSGVFGIGSQLIASGMDIGGT